jgi:hypothetical protein
MPIGVIAGAAGGAVAALALLGLGVYLYKRKAKKQLAMAAVIIPSQPASVVHDTLPQSSKSDGALSTQVAGPSDVENKEQAAESKQEKLTREWQAQNDPDPDLKSNHQPPPAAAELMMWLTESCGLNEDDVTLYTEAFVQLGIDKPEHLQMIDGEEVAWPAIVKPVHRKRIQASLEPGTSMASPRSREGSLVSDRL